ncbi:MAG: hypothetical protein M1812_007645 [Candelaria pacifica]|nr:MAG: hypothetical protein M1812_007645 [Candelaria pacifica]
MSGRRAPLADIRNAANSPYRAVAAAAKRSRSHSSVQRELPYSQAPPAKRQMLEVDQSNLRTPPRQQTLEATEGRVFNKRPTGSQPTAFERKLHAARDAQTQRKAAAVAAAKNEQVTTENLENVRQWQRHYRRVFPHYVFYFESLPEEARSKCSKQINALGAREEKFFSKAVTHVITTRAIPAESETSASTDAVTPPSTTAGSQAQNGQPRTINPSLLDRSSESTQNDTVLVSAKGRFTFEASLGKRYNNGSRVDSTHVVQDGEPRKQLNLNGDVLVRAREMGMKIWALEKLQRMMTTMFDPETGIQLHHGHNTRGNSASAASNARANRGADLSQLLRNERLNGPSDRDPTVATKEMVQLRGPFIYIHDMEEKTRPVMVREYKKVPKGEIGEWPQFHSTTFGKCPFVEETIHSKREHERELAKQRLDAESKLSKATTAAPRTRATAATEAARMQPPVTGLRKNPLGEATDRLNRVTQAAADAPSVKLFGPLKALPTKRASPDRVFRAAHSSQTAFGTTSRFHGGEPVASGVQPSNVTSAIRSQMMSSTAAAPGAKAGTSKEVYELKRKVLEKNSGPSTIGTLSSHRMTDIAGAGGAEKAIVTTRVAKRKAQKKLGYINEDFTPSEEEENARRLEVAKAAGLLKRKKSEKKDMKPGYCENCREKFDDFEQHTFSRKHRKFAVDAENWSELDSLLKDLVRPLKQR